VPFFQGVGGSGAVPFFHGVGGNGAVPFAIRMEPSLCAATAVFKPIAPTKISMARDTTASLRDIVPPGYGKTPDTLYPVAQESQAPRSTDL
jgi:hypothetical protein